MQSLQKILEAFLDFLFPAECTFCKNFLGEERILNFCKNCWGRVELIKDSVCCGCGRPFPSQNVSETAPDFTCENCRKGLYYFDKARAVGKYEGVLKEAIHQFKYEPTRAGRGKPGLGRHLAKFMIQYLPSDLNLNTFDRIIPVPLHENRKRWRGFNQSEILGKFLGQHYQIPLDTHHLYRIKETQPQVELTGRERIKNVRGAFVVQRAEDLEGKKVVLVDDVFTTGSTVNESSRMLKKAGVREILVLTLARA
jgi:ComF family protein